MKLTLLCAAMSILGSFIASSQEVLWQKQFGRSYQDYAFDGLATPDNGYLILGRTNSFPLDSAMAERAYLIRLDEDGALQWEKGIRRHYVTVPEAIFHHDSNRSLVIGTGESELNEGVLTHLCVFVVDSSGAVVSDLHHEEDSAFTLSRVIRTSDGGFAVIGSTTGLDADVRLWKLDGNGGLEWQKRYWTGGMDYGHAVVQLSDSGYMMTGIATWPGVTERDVILRRTDAEGNSLWARQYAAPTRDEGIELFEESNGNVMVVTQSYSELGEGRAVLWDVTPSGDLISKDTIGSLSVGIQSARRSPGGSLIIAGFTNQASPMAAYLARLAPDRTLQWEMRYATGQFSHSGLGVVVASEAVSLLVGMIGNGGGGDALVTKIGMLSADVADEGWIPKRIDLR